MAHIGRLCLALSKYLKIAIVIIITAEMTYLGIRDNCSTKSQVKSSQVAFNKGDKCTFVQLK